MHSKGLFRGNTYFVRKWAVGKRLVIALDLTRKDFWFGLIRISDGEKVKWYFGIPMVVLTVYHYNKKDK